MSPSAQKLECKTKTPFHIDLWMSWTEAIVVDLLQSISKKSNRDFSDKLEST